MFIFFFLYVWQYLSNAIHVLWIFSEIIVTNISRKSTNTKNITPFNNFLIDNFFINEKYLDSLSPEQVG